MSESREIPFLVDVIFQCTNCRHVLHARRAGGDVNWVGDSGQTVFCDCGRIYGISCLPKPAVDDITYLGK